MSIFCTPKSLQSNIFCYDILLLHITWLKFCSTIFMFQRTFVNVRIIKFLFETIACLGYRAMVFILMRRKPLAFRCTKPTWYALLLFRQGRRVDCTDHANCEITNIYKPSFDIPHSNIIKTSTREYQKCYILLDFFKVFY